MEAGFGQSAIFPLGRKQLNQSSDTVQVGKLRPFPPSARRLPALSHHHNHHHHHQVAGTRPTRRRRQLDSDQSTRLGPGTGARPANGCALAESGFRLTAESGGIRPESPDGGIRFPALPGSAGCGPGVAAGRGRRGADLRGGDSRAGADGPCRRTSCAGQLRCAGLRAVSGRRHAWPVSARKSGRSEGKIWSARGDGERRACRAGPSAPGRQGAAAKSAQLRCDVATPLAALLSFKTPNLRPKQ